MIFTLKISGIYSLLTFFFNVFKPCKDKIYKFCYSNHKNIFINYIFDIKFLIIKRIILLFYYPFQLE